MSVTRVQRRTDDLLDAEIGGTWWTGIHRSSRFWPEVQEWIAAGNVPEGAPLTPPDPGVAKRKALLDALDAFEQDGNPSLAKVKPVLKALREYLP